MSSIIASAVSVVTGSSSSSGNGSASQMSSFPSSNDNSVTSEILDEITAVTTTSESVPQVNMQTNDVERTTHQEASLHNTSHVNESQTEPSTSSSSANTLISKDSSDISNPGPLSKDYQQEVILFKARTAAQLADALNRFAETEGHQSASQKLEDQQDVTNDASVNIESKTSSENDSIESLQSSGSSEVNPDKGSASGNGSFWSIIPTFINKMRVKTRANNGTSNDSECNDPESTVGSQSCTADSEASNSASAATSNSASQSTSSSSSASTTLSAQPPNTPSRLSTSNQTENISTSGTPHEEKDHERDGRLERENLADRQAARREAKFLRLLDSAVVDLKELRQLAWKGVPPSMRSATWQILLGYLPQNVERRVPALARKRREYALYLQQDYYASDRPRSAAEDELLDQIRKDLPRMVPKHPFFHIPVIQLLMERVLYIWAIRHPASGYVQGLNDVAIPLLTVFIEAATGHDIYSLNQIAAIILGRKAPTRPPSVYSSSSNASSVTVNSTLSAIEERSVVSEGASTEAASDKDTTSSESDCSSVSTSTSSTVAQMEQLLSSILSPAALGGVEADTFWCMTSLIDSIQDHYTFAQPGIQRMIYKLQELTNRVDPELYEHLVVKNQLQFVQFAFRWINCLFMREVGLHLIVRLWDTCLADDKGTGFEDYYVYLMLALLRKWRDTLLKLDFQGIVVFLQHLPTDGWTEADIEVLTSEAYVYQSVYC